MSKELIISKLRESAEIKLKLAKESLQEIADAAELIQKCLRAGGKVLIFGNGGSASDSQHIAAELVNRYQKERKALAALALTTDASILTSISNDSGFENVFSRQIEALGKKGDVAWGISTSGRSPNVVKALEAAKQGGMKTLALTGGDGGKLKKIADLSIIIPSSSTARIQEAHITIAHILCEIIEEAACVKRDPPKGKPQDL
ncbi:MAG: D-sedoheptulose 7-phosphate isomerase [Deltaproteobacteria bacterium]